ncbi:MAG: hypothetical protein EPO68_04300 [Planctomycetota bacterium]|nr:MAG: hypothetical protein EPO68_04300 [Planctomycetota bacterium]
MSERRAWVLNLDAEHELEAPRHYEPTRHLKSIVQRERVRLLGALVRPQDVLVTEEALRERGAELARGLAGHAWSPTPRALRLLRAAGAIPVDVPTLEVLREVNARPFAASVREPLQLASFDKRVVATLDEGLVQLARPAPHGWLVRRSFGAAGRGRRRIASGRPDAGELAWLVASLRRGPLVVEPWVEIVREHTRSGWITREGAVSISAPCFQAVDEHGAWTRTELAELDALARDDDRRLEEAMEVVGRALAARGYFGAFGVDAYRHRALDGSGRTVLNPLSEINARYTMDWALAMGERAVATASSGTRPTSPAARRAPSRTPCAAPQRLPPDRP